MTTQTGVQGGRRRRNQHLFYLSDLPSLLVVLGPIIMCVHVMLKEELLAVVVVVVVVVEGLFDC